MRYALQRVFVLIQFTLEVLLAGVLQTGVCYVKFLSQGAQSEKKTKKDWRSRFWCDLKFRPVP